MVKLIGNLCKYIIICASRDAIQHGGLGSGKERYVTVVA